MGFEFLVARTRGDRPKGNFVARGPVWISQQGDNPVRGRYAKDDVGGLGEDLLKIKY